MAPYVGARRRRGAAADQTRPGEPAQRRSRRPARQEAFGWIVRTIMAQASLLAFIDVFFVLAVIAALVAPVALLLRSEPARGGEAGR